MPLNGLSVVSSMTASLLMSDKAGNMLEPDGLRSIVPAAHCTFEGSGSSGAMHFLVHI